MTSPFKWFSERALRIGAAALVPYFGYTKYVMGDTVEQAVVNSIFFGIVMFIGFCAGRENQ